MGKASERKIVLVRRKTRLDELLTRFNSISQAKFYIEHLGADFHDYEIEHTEYYEAIKHTTAIAESYARVQGLDRAYLSNFIFAPDDLVLAVGQDGLVANTLKYLDGQPLLGVNPSPGRWDGVLLPFLVHDLDNIIPETLNRRRKFNEVTMAAVKLNDDQSLLAVNDFFVGQKTHISARYELTYKESTEWQSSSGIIISTGLGSTGWFKSVLTGAKSVINNIADKNIEIKSENHFNWNSDYLYFSVREPFPSKTTSTEIVFGKITKETPLKIVSQMPENGVIFSDGIENDFLSFNAGVEAIISIADKKGLLVI